MDFISRNNSGLIFPYKVKIRVEGTLNAGLKTQKTGQPCVHRGSNWKRAVLAPQTLGDFCAHELSPWFFSQASEGLPADTHLSPWPLRLQTVLHPSL